MANPSEIPKRVWLTFTHKPADRSSAVFISAEPPPESWQQGARYEVFIHMPPLEDYSATARNLQEAIDNPASIMPIHWRYEWHYDLVDGAPSDARSRFPTHLPRPPREPKGRDKEECHRELSGQEEQRSFDERGRHNDSRGNGDRRDARDAYDAGAGGCGRAQCACRGPQDECERGRDKERAGRSSCKDRAFIWPLHRGDGDDEDGSDYIHPGHEQQYDDDYWGIGKHFCRDCTRSPPHRDYGPRHG